MLSGQYNKNVCQCRPTFIDAGKNLSSLGEDSNYDSFAGDDDKDPDFEMPMKKTRFEKTDTSNVSQRALNSNNKKLTTKQIVGRLNQKFSNLPSEIVISKNKSIGSENGAVKI